MNQKLMGRWIMGRQVIKQAKYNNNIKFTFHAPWTHIISSKKYMLIGERFLPEGRTQFPDSGEGLFTRTGTYHCLMGTEGQHINPVYIDINTARLIDEKLGVPSTHDPLVKNMM